MLLNLKTPFYLINLFCQFAESLNLLQIRFKEILSLNKNKNIKHAIIIY